MNLRKILIFITTSISHELYYRLAYLRQRKRFPRLKRPKDIVEVWISKILSDAFTPYSYLADKYKVRDYVASKGLSTILPELLGVWSRAEDIDFDRLPERFVLKTNNGCGTNIICLDKSTLDRENAVKNLNNWLKIKFDIEKHYNHIEPLIIAEEYIQDGELPAPIDYKIYSIHGEPVCILVCSDRTRDGLNIFAYDLQWNLRQDWVRSSEEKPFPKPRHLEEMITCAKILSRGIDLVRVDLYHTDKTVYFGEMTLTPEGGLLRCYTDEAIKMMGNAYFKKQEEC